jgi:hypothetical protein
MSVFCQQWHNMAIVILVNNQLDALLSMYISLLYMFRATQCSSSGESIVSIHHLPEWHIPDNVLIQLILLMMSTGLLETCREVKQIHWKKCVKLVINQNYAEMHGQQNIKWQSYLFLLHTWQQRHLHGNSECVFV